MREEKKKKASKQNFKNIVTKLPGYLAFSYFHKYCPKLTKEL